MRRLRAKRMSPEGRRRFILDAAVNLIVSNGHSGCTLEQVAAVAGISKPLIYKYFPKREDLLKAILDREFEELRGRGLNAVPENVAPEKVVRETVERALSYYFDRGPIVRLLANDSAVSELVKQRNRAQRANATSYFIKKFVESYGVPKDVAIIAVIMVMNAPILSIPEFRQRGIGADLTIEVWSAFIIGGWKALEARYRMSGKAAAVAPPIRRRARNERAGDRERRRRL